MPGGCTVGEGQLPLRSFLKTTWFPEGVRGGEGQLVSVSTAGKQGGEATSLPPAVILSSCDSSGNRQVPPQRAPSCLPSLWTAPGPLTTHGSKPRARWQFLSFLGSRDLSPSLQEGPLNFLILSDLVVHTDLPLSSTGGDACPLSRLGLRLCPQFWPHTG